MRRGRARAAAVAGESLEGMVLAVCLRAWRLRGSSCCGVGALGSFGEGVLGFERRLRRRRVVVVAMGVLTLNCFPTQNGEEK